MNTDTAHDPSPVLEVRELRKVFGGKGLFQSQPPVPAAHEVSFRIARGEAIALVGESGSGKSTIARILLRLESPDGGSIRIHGEDVLAREPRQASLRYRGQVQMVFQDPYGSLNPVHDVAHHLERPLLRHGRASRDDVREKTLALLRLVGLEPAEEFLHRRPYELSGGQRQRVAIARALAVEPDVLVADEPTSMLDVSIRIGILALLDRLKRERRLGILLITHDLASARYLADRILVLFRGRVVEVGPTSDVVERPAHPYTRALLAAIAETDAPQASAPRPLAPEATTGGCPFRSRCADAIEVCVTEDPAPRLFEGRAVRCHLYPAHPPETGVRP